MNISRRELLLGIGAAPLVLKAQRSSRPRLAAICTTYFKYSHAQHIVDRFLEGYGWNGTHHHPEMDLVSIFIDQIGDNDVSKTRLSEFPSMKLYPSIAEALTLGGSTLAVDGVLLIGEHGRYPRNEKGQTLYPRYEFFQQIVKVFKDSGRSVPGLQRQAPLVEAGTGRRRCTTRRGSMGFPLMAGSSLPVTWRTPSVEMPLGRAGSGGRVRLLRRRRQLRLPRPRNAPVHGRAAQGGETGVKWLQAYRGETFWKAHQEGVWSKELVEAALCRSHTLKPARQGFNDVFPGVDEMRTLVKDPIAYRYEHQDGLKCTMLLMGGLVEDFNFAARIDGRPEHLLDPDVPADAAGADEPGQLLQPAREQRRTDVPDRQGDLSARAHAAHDRADRRGRREPVPATGEVRDTAPGHRVSGPEGVDVLENLT